MTTPQLLAVLGAGAGTLGSIITAFSLNGVVSVLNAARNALELSNEVAATSNDRVVVRGFDELMRTASWRGTKLLWLGVALLALGFVFQALSIFWLPEAPAAQPG